MTVKSIKSFFEHSGLDKEKKIKVKKKKLILTDDDVFKKRANHVFNGSPPDFFMTVLNIQQN